MKHLAWLWGQSADTSCVQGAGSDPHGAGPEHTAPPSCPPSLTQHRYIQHLQEGLHNLKTTKKKIFYEDEGWQLRDASKVEVWVGD